MENIKSKKPIADFKLRHGDHIVIRTEGRKVFENNIPGWKYTIRVDEFGKIDIAKELRNYG